jgi:peptide/nickel transport system ATP-binding protein
LISHNGTLLNVEGLKTYFFSREGTLRAVDGVSFSISRGRTLGVAGESGCGKSVTAQSILRIVPGNGRIVDGSIMFTPGDREPIDLTALNPESRLMRSMRGQEIAMIFQEPMTSFSPVHTVGDQIAEVLRLHRKVDRRGGRELAVKLLDQVGLPKPEQLFDAYPFNLSGGMRQRAMIAMALSCRPKLLIADEPTTAVDVTIQAQVLELMKEMQSQLGMALMIITHDLGVIAELADDVFIMYLGRNVESGPVLDVFSDPKHPYTQGLMASVPRLGGGPRRTRQKIASIPGAVPSPYAAPGGCPFHPRCSERIRGVCETGQPSYAEVAEGHRVSCFLFNSKPISGEGTPS